MSGLTIDSGGLIAFDRNDRAVVAIFARALQRGLRLACLPASSDKCGATAGGRFGSLAYSPRIWSRLKRSTTGGPARPASSAAQPVRATLSTPP